MAETFGTCSPLSFFLARVLCSGRRLPHPCRFDDNACVLLNNKGEMIGTRVNGVVAAELRDIQGGPAGSGGRWGKVLGLAGKVGLASRYWQGTQANVNWSGRIIGYRETGQQVPEQRRRAVSRGEDDHVFRRGRGVRETSCIWLYHRTAYLHY